MNYGKVMMRRAGSRLSVAALLLLCSIAGAYGQADTSYKGVGRDPFARPKPKPVVVKPPTVMKAPPGQMPPPTIQIRIDNYRAQKAIDVENNRPVQKPTSMMLLNEIEVTGIVRTPRGYAAMIEAKPFKLSYTIYPGELFYDGQLVGVEDNRLVFRRDIRWTNNKVTTVVEMKQLRQPTKLSDPLTTAEQSGARSSGR